jgi:hypothetical protein
MAALQHPCRMDTKPGKEKASDDACQNVYGGHKEISLFQESEGLITERGKGGQAAQKANGKTGPQGDREQGAAHAELHDQTDEK